jgi:hypothetical protein
MPDGSPVSGINVPGISTPSGPMLDPTTGMPATEGEGLVKGLVIAAAVVGVGLLAWKFLKGRGSGAKETQQVLGMAMGNEGAAGIDGLKKLLGAIKPGSVGADDLVQVQQALAMSQLAGGGALAAGGLGDDLGRLAVRSQGAAGAYGYLMGLGPVDGFIMQATAGSVAANQPFETIARLMLENQKVGIARQAVMNGGGLADLALANVAGANLTGAVGGAAAGAGKLTSARQLLEACSGRWADPDDRRTATCTRARMPPWHRTPTTRSRPARCDFPRGCASRRSSSA